MTLGAAALAAAAVVLATIGGSSGSGLPLRQLADVELPGADNRFDYQSLDPTTNRDRLEGWLWDKLTYVL